MVPASRRFHIHGDNIVECERALQLIIQALGPLSPVRSGPLDSPFCPRFEVTTRSRGTFHFTCFPGYGRWDHDVLANLRARGGVLKEAPDALVSEVLDGNEKPLLALEFCGALPAGNQAWQRSGRAYSVVRAGVPYVYLSEVGGFELNAERGQKAPRMPNPAVPFSYVSYAAVAERALAPVFVASPAASAAARAALQPFFGEADLSALIDAIFHGNSTSEPLSALQAKAVALTAALAGQAKRSTSTFSSAQWKAAAVHVVSGGELIPYVLAQPPLAWAKKVAKKTATPSAQALMKETARLAVGLTAADLPFCLLTEVARKTLATWIEGHYPGIDAVFNTWMGRSKPLVICWINGFKPKGDDARPDRGLPALARMLIGDQADLLTVVYGPAKVNHWNLLETDPVRLAASNGLWDVILRLSDAVLVDSKSHVHRPRRAYTSAHWTFPAAGGTANLPQVSPMPVSIGENDVDSALHVLLAHSGASSVFEGLCNPPGGDWSGISLREVGGGTEVRWMSLPRVSVASKRPDHVFQIIGLEKDIEFVLVIESKERHGDVEQNIGPALKKYVEDLVTTQPHIERSAGGPWNSRTTRFSSKHLRTVSAVAFLNVPPKADAQLLATSGADLLVSIEPQVGGLPIIRTTSATADGLLVKGCLAKLVAQSPQLFL